MPFAIEPNAAPTLEIPAPIVTSPTSSDRKTDSGPSFQDHLDRMNRSTDSGDDRSTTVQPPEARTENDDREERNDSDRGDANRGDRTEASRRDEAHDRPSHTDDTGTAKPKQDDTTKVGERHGKAEAKKDHGSKDRKHDKSKDSDAGNTVVAVAVAQQPVKKDEVTLTAAGSEADAAAAKIAEAARAAAKGTEKPEKPTADKGRHVDPKVEAAKKEAGAKADAKATVDAAVVKADPKADAAQAAADAGAAKVADATVPTTVAATAAQIVSEQHGTKTLKNSEKSAAAKADATTAVAGKDDVVSDAVAATTKNEPTAVADAKPAVKEEVAPTASSEKKSGEAKNDAAATAATLTAQLQSAVEAAAASGANAAAAATTATLATDVAANVDTVGTATTAKTTAADATTPATKLTNDQASPELLRTTSSNDGLTSRVVGGDTERNGGLSNADRNRLIQRVARAFQTAKDRGGELQIRLSPPELGQLKLQVQMTDGTLSARIEAETPHARQVITENLNVLRERLADQNVRVDRIDVELMNSGNGGSPNMFDRRNDPSQDGSAPRGFGNTLRNGGGGGDAAVVDARSTGSAMSADGRLNVVI